MSLKDLPGLQPVGRTASFYSSTHEAGAAWSTQHVQVLQSETLPGKRKGSCLKFMVRASTVSNVACHLDSVDVIHLSKPDYVRHLLYLQEIPKSQEWLLLLL